MVTRPGSFSAMQPVWFTVASIQPRIAAFSASVGCGRLFGGMMPPSSARLRKTTHRCSNWRRQPGPRAPRVHEAGAARAALVLGHGAGGGIDSPDLAAATAAATAAAVSVALVEQPYRVAGRRAPPRAP